MSSASSKAPHELLPSQRNAILDEIEVSDLDPLEFEWTKRFSWLGVEAPVLLYRPTSYYFLFEFEGGSHKCEYSPGSDRPMQRLDIGEWIGITVAFDDWVKNVKREIVQPDLWAELKEGPSAGKLAVATGPEGPRSADLFAQEEQAIISRELHAIRELIVAKAELTETQLADLDERLDHVEHAATHMTRRDWMTLFLGTVLSLTMQHVIDGGLAVEVICVASESLGHLFGPSGFPALPTAGTVPPV